MPHVTKGADNQPGLFNMTFICRLTCALRAAVVDRAAARDAIEAREITTRDAVARDAEDYFICSRADMRRAVAS